MKKGTELNQDDRAYVLSAYVHRFTKDHRPQWSLIPRPDGTAYPIQFASDEEWLANTYFQVKQDGTLDKRFSACHSEPTWPDNKEESE